MAKTGLLILSNPKGIAGILPNVLEHVKNTLYIHWTPTELKIDKTNWAKFSNLVSRMYYQSSIHCEYIDARVLLTPIKYTEKQIITKSKIEVLFFDKYYNEKEIETIKNRITNSIAKLPCITIIPTEEDSEMSLEDNVKICANGICELKNEKIYESVVLGGTFDRLHGGHKILLSEALMRTCKKLTVGVTDRNMLLSKKLWELIEPCEVRINNVKQFLNDVDPKIDSDVVAIQDPFGPTKTDETFQMIVVSSETVGGGKKVNELRCLNNLRTLDIHSISLIGSGKFFEGEEEKISSSNYRMRLLGTRLKPIADKTVFKSKPYVIGLTGGIASGKSSISKRFQQLGAYLIDCDKIAHELYLPGAKCHQLVVDHFGEKVLDENGFVNRKILGEIVFNDKEQLKKLNSFIWPAIAEETDNRIRKLGEEGVKIVIVEAAVLLRANWMGRYHEIWVCIIPPEEAVKRLRERNGLSEDDARSRLSAQPSNCDYVQVANIVFSTYWSHNFTQQQVEKAWAILNKDITQFGN